MVLPTQVCALMDFLECHKELALGYLGRTNEGRSQSKRLWDQCANILNAVAANCPTKTGAEWRAFYNDYKSKLVKKIKDQKKGLSGTGGGKFCHMPLSTSQERLYDIFGRDLGEPLEGVRHNPLIPVGDLAVNTIPSPMHEFLDVYAPEENRCHASFSILEGQAETVNLGASTSAVTQTEIREGVARSSLSLSPPPPKRRRRSDYISAKQDDEDKLEQAQQRLERIEACKAEATLKHAQATLEMAQATTELARATAAQAQSQQRVGDILEKFLEAYMKTLEK